MTSPAVLENKISSIQKYLLILKRYQKRTREELENDVDIRGAVERYLYLVAQATIDVAEAVIAYKGFRKPSTLSESFYILQEEAVLPPELTEKLAGMVGFRNVIAHDYEKVNYDIVYAVLHERLKDVEKFVSLVKERIL